MTGQVIGARFPIASTFLPSDEQESAGLRWQSQLGGPHRTAAPIATIVDAESLGELWSESWRLWAGTRCNPLFARRNKLDALFGTLGVCRHPSGLRIPGRHAKGLKTLGGGD